MISSRASILRSGLLERTGSVALSGGKDLRLAESVPATAFPANIHADGEKLGLVPDLDV